MEHSDIFDVIIIGGSNAGLSAGMSLARALRKVLIIDSGTPCNKQTPESHNFLTHDGRKPAEILEAGKAQLLKYSTVSILKSLATGASGSNNNFEVSTFDSRRFVSKKLLFATGVKDIMPDIDGFAECWGISVLHCPYCHGYEFKERKTGVLTNGEFATDFGMLIRNWTNDLTLFTNGESTLTQEQLQKLSKRNITLVEKRIKNLTHQKGYIQSILFEDGSSQELEAVYARPPFEQHCKIPEQLGCAVNDQGYIEVDEFKRTTVPGIYAAGDNITRFRSVANAVASGNTAGAFINHDLINEEV